MATRQGQPSQRRTIEQERAQQAWHNIEQIRPRKKQEGETEQQRKAREKEEKRAREYSSRAKSLPSMIQTNGLGATLAFLRAKAGTEHTAADYKLYEHIASRIIYYLEYSSEDVMDMIRNADTSTYRRATTEAIAFGIWLKRYVEAEGWDEEK